MPTLDDAPIITTLIGSNLVSSVVTSGGTDTTTSPACLNKADLVQVYDMSTRKPKTITVANFALALGITVA